ncbi:hypothetical protein FKM82_009142 [Ascaphus truei]
MLGTCCHKGAQLVSLSDGHHDCPLPCGRKSASLYQAKHFWIPVSVLHWYRLLHESLVLNVAYVPIGSSPLTVICCSLPASQSGSR